MLPTVSPTKDPTPEPTFSPTRRPTPLPVPTVELTDAPSTILVTSDKPAEPLTTVSKVVVLSAVVAALLITLILERIKTVTYRVASLQISDY